MSDFTIHVQDPWTMPYVEYADVLINALHKQLGPKHLLFRRKAFPIALRRNPDAIIYETNDEPQIYALVYLSWSRDAMERKRRGNPKTELFLDRQAIQIRIDGDHEDWVAQFK